MKSAQPPAPSDFDRFRGTAHYITSPPLDQAVNAALALGRPLLVKGEPGTGKTMLAVHVAQALGLPLIRWQVKSTTKAADGLYVYDTVQRLHDSRFGDANVSDISRYIRLGPLGQAFTAKEQLVLLIDEVDKADLEFPNDLLNELDLMEFDVLETGEHVCAAHRPVVIITSNNEKELPDAFDVAFASAFAGLESEALSLSEELLGWLEDPLLRRQLGQRDRAALEALDLERLRQLFAQRLAQQRERHDRGDRWIGSGGTSPFGQGGSHPGGIRVGPQGGGRSAVQVAAERRYRAYRSDLVLDVRQIGLALRKLRELRREGEQSELDLEETVRRTGRNAGELELSWRPPRRNRVRVLLMMDVGGSMDPHAELVSRLFSAALAARHFRSLQSFYFHNCVYDKVYRDASFRQALPLAELLRSYGPAHKLILVGDALMHPLELLEPGGSLDYWQRNSTPGVERLRRLSEHYRRAIWLNPEPEPLWDHLTVQTIRQLFPMYPLTLQGLERGIAALVQGKRQPPALAVAGA